MLKYADLFSGVTLLRDDQVTNINQVQIQKDKVKVVAGPGTGFGMAYLCKSKSAPYHEVYPAEACFTEWLPKTEQEKRLQLYIKNKDK